MITKKAIESIIHSFIGDELQYRTEIYEHVLSFRINIFLYHGIMANKLRELYLAFGMNDNEVEIHGWSNEEECGPLISFRLKQMPEEVQKENPHT